MVKEGKTASVKEEKVNLKQLSLFITKRCNMRCKRCSGRIPYVRNPQDVPIENLIQIIDAFFEVVDSVDKVSICGGETFLHNDLDKVFDYLKVNYYNRVARMEIFTNGTIIPGEDIWKSLYRVRDKMTVFIDNYGEALSKNIGELERKCKEEKITYVHREYNNKIAHCGGWVDFGKMTHEVWVQGEESECACVYKKLCGNGTSDGIFYPCTPARIQAEFHLNENAKKDAVNLLDDTLTREQKRKRLVELNNMGSYEACKYCLGMSDASERFVPAEQLSREEMAFVKKGARSYQEVMEMKEGEKWNKD